MDSGIPVQLPGYPDPLPGVLEYTGEFGPELVCFIPTILWLEQAGLLRGRQVVSYAGMQPFYDFLDDGRFVEKKVRRRYVRPEHRLSFLANANERTSRESCFEVFPDYRQQFYAERLVFDSPVLVVHNKYSDEWHLGSVNHIPEELLDKLFARFKHRFQIVYFREGIGPTDDLFSTDHNVPLPFGDREVLDRHPEVMLFDDLRSDWPGLSYNALKLRLFAGTWLFVSSQGGGSYMSAMFGGSLIIVLHRAGRELRHAYADGFFRYCSNPAPVVLVTRESRQLERALDVLDHVGIIDGRVHVGTDMRDVMNRYSASAQQDKEHRVQMPERL